MVTLFGLQAKVNMREILHGLIISADVPHSKRLVQCSEEYKRLQVNMMCSNEYCKKAATLIREYNFSILDFPHLIVRLQKKTIRYYIISLMTHNPTEKMTLAQVMELIEGYKSAQILLVQDMIYQELYNEAWVLATQYKLWEYMSPAEQTTLKTKVLHPEEVMKKFAEDSADRFGPLTPDAFVMPCKLEDILFVDSSATLQIAKEKFVGAKIIGIDSEWRASIMTFVESRPAILQVASETFFAIFDLLKLEGNAEFSELIKGLFMSMDILKLGLALKGDIRLICSKFPKMTCFQHVFNYIDIAEMYKEKNPCERQSSLACITEKTLSTQGG